jgi:hypothetical protein
MAVSTGSPKLRLARPRRQNPVAVRRRHEPLLCLDISDWLSAEGYEVIAVTNADHAIKALEFRNDIHMIFTDIDIPVPWTD